MITLIPHTHANIELIGFLLISAHFFGDYVWQSEFMALGKNVSKPLPGTPFWWPLTAHSWVHATLVLLIMGSWQAMLLELVSHWLIDYSKCRGWFSRGTLTAFTIDQLLHLLVMLIILTAFY
mgnify:CR=1 FL=1